MLTKGLGSFVLNALARRPQRKVSESEVDSRNSGWVLAATFVHERTEENDQEGQIIGE